MAPKRPKIAPRRPKTAQDGPRSRGEAAQDGTQTAPRGLPECPKPLRDVAREPFGSPRPQGASRPPQNEPQSGPKIAQETRIRWKIATCVPPCASRADWGTPPSTSLSQLSFSDSPQLLRHKNHAKTCVFSDISDLGPLSEEPQWLVHKRQGAAVIRRRRCRSAAPCGS